MILESGHAEHGVESRGAGRVLASARRQDTYARTRLSYCYADYGRNSWPPTPIVLPHAATTTPSPHDTSLFPQKSKSRVFRAHLSNGEEG
jgi:hypothetical protein